MEADQQEHHTKHDRVVRLAEAFELLRACHGLGGIPEQPARHPFTSGGRRRAKCGPDNERHHGDQKQCPLTGREPLGFRNVEREHAVQPKRYQRGHAAIDDE
jgi:hypothetical protein